MRKFIIILLITLVYALWRSYQNRVFLEPVARYGYVFGQTFGILIFSSIAPLIIFLAHKLFGRKPSESGARFPSELLWGSFLVMSIMVGYIVGVGEQSGKHRSEPTQNIQNK